MSLEVKIIAGALLFLILGGATYFAYRSVYSAGVKYGSTEVQSAWDTDKAKIQAVTDAAIAQATAQKDMALQANEVIANDYQTQLSAAVADADSLAQRLRSAEARLAAGSGTVSQAANNPGTSTGSTPSGVGPIDAATGATLAECAVVRAGYKALIAELTPQL